MHAGQVSTVPTELYHQALELDIDLKVLRNTDQSGSGRVGGWVESLASTGGPRGAGASQIVESKERN